MEFTINGTSVPQVEKYDNQGAHNAIKSMMQRKKHLASDYTQTRTIILASGLNLTMWQDSNTMSPRFLSNGYTPI